MYILENGQGGFYVGQTEHLDHRLVAHNSADDGRKYTHKHGPWKLVWSEEHPDRSTAMARERQIKGMKSAHWIREHLLHRQSESRRAGINR